MHYQESTNGERPLLAITPADLLGGALLILLVAAIGGCAYASARHADQRAQCSYLGGTVVDDACLMPKGVVP